MKTTTIKLFVLGLAALLAPWVAPAQPNPNPPGQISYQGFLTDANGIPLATNAPKNYTIIFRVWDSSSAGSNIWAEQQVVTVDRGYFTVMLGNGSSVGAPFTNNLTTIFSGSSASDRYLGMTATDLSPNEIAPRLRLLASPYSLLASRAMSVDAGGKVPDSSLSTNVALRAGGNTFSGNQIITNGTVGIGTTSTGLNTMQINSPFAGASGYGLLVCKNDFGQDIQINRSAGTGGIGLVVDDAAAGDSSTSMLLVRNNTGVSSQNLFDVLANGNVGIGTASPGFPLNFNTVLGDKISLWGNAGNYYGFGVQANQLQIHTDVSSSDVVFGYGQSGAMTESMRITGTGNLVMGNSGTINAKNASGTIENFLYPRWSDNATYLNYGSAGFYIRNNSSSGTMFMANNGYVGINNSAPETPLQVGNYGVADQYVTVSTSGGNLYRSGIKLRHFNSAYGVTLVSDERDSTFRIIDNLADTNGFTALCMDRFSGNINIGTNIPSHPFQVGNTPSPAYCNGTTWVNGSDRASKEDFSEVNPVAVLEKVAALPINEWKYKTESDGTRHIGPVAQDFHAAFGLNGPDDKHIATVDEGGVALAAIQGLNQKLAEKDHEITELKQRLERLEQLLNHNSNGAAR